VRIRNLSSSGAMIDGASLPADGSKVRLQRGSLIAGGEIVRPGGGKCAIRFEGSIDVQKWVRGGGHAGQERVDEVISSLRRSERPPEQGPAVSLGSFEAISAALDEVCERLATVPGMSVQLGEELIKLDVIAQSLRGMVARLKD
jgi:hypothetical protein